MYRPYLYQNLIAITYITSTWKAHKYGKIASVILIMSGILISLGILLFTLINFDCFSMPNGFFPKQFCPNYEERREYLWNWSNKLIILATCSYWMAFITLIIMPHSILKMTGKKVSKELLCSCELVDEVNKSWFKPSVTNSRNIASLVRTGNFEGLVDIVEFGFKIPKNVTKQQILNKCLNVILNSHKDVSIHNIIRYFKYFYDTYGTPVDFLVCMFVFIYLHFIS